MPYYDKLSERKERSEKVRIVAQDILVTGLSVSFKQLGGNALSRYIGSPFNGVLIILREPNSNGRTVSVSDNEWIRKVLNGEETVNANKYRKTFYSLLELVGLERDDLPHIAFDNIKPNGGQSHQSPEYKKIESSEKAKTAFTIINEINPTYIFTCIDIFEAIKEQLTTQGCFYVENDGVRYTSNSKTKRKLELEFNEKTIYIYEIYHPSMGWNINR